jgi:hypothetical protein
MAYSGRIQITYSDILWFVAGYEEERSDGDGWMQVHRSQ